MAKTPAKRLAKAEKRLRKAQRRAQKAVAVAAAARKAAARPEPVRPWQPAAGTFDDHLVTKASAGDIAARELLRKRGTDSVYAAQARHVLTTCTDPGQRAYAAGLLAQLDEDFDPLGPLPRPGGGTW